MNARPPSDILNVVQRTVSMVKAMFSGREGAALLISMTSVLIAALSFGVAKQGLDATRDKDRAARLLFLTGRPSDDGTSMRIRAAEPNTVFRAMTVKFEYAEHGSDFDVPPTSDFLTIPMEYARPHLMRRVEYLRSSDQYKKTVLPAGPVQLDGRIPLLIYSKYVAAGDVLEDLSLYAMTFSAHWKKESPDVTLKITGIGFCARVPIAEKKEWLADDHVFVGVDASGSVPGPKKLRFVNC